jgi:DNA-binding response OmpR family regulator
LNCKRAAILLPREFTLLEYLMRRPGQVVTRAMLLEDVWNFNFLAQTNVVDVQIGNLRRKLDPTGARRFIVNIRAVGLKTECGRLTESSTVSPFAQGAWRTSIIVSEHLMRS